MEDISHDSLFIVVISDLSWGTFILFRGIRLKVLSVPMLALRIARLGGLAPVLFLMLLCRGPKVMLGQVFNHRPAKTIRIGSSHN